MEPTEPNRRAFDQAYMRRRGAQRGLPAIVKATLGDLSGKRVLHLQCGSGDATAELAEQGAVVTAVDPSEALLEAARAQWPKILWIQAEAQALPAELRRGRFDLVYSPEGTLARLTDLNAWARGIAEVLHERGELLVYDEHPVAVCVDAFRRWQQDYFGEGLWRLGAVVTTLARARLRVEALEEYPGERRVPGTFLLYASRRSE
jgi:ubiquinone/menaquinone biosynthesis C-methylase UbiE